MTESKRFTLEELRPFDGVQADKIYVAILGEVFDVSSKPAFYGRGGSYSVFAGRDATRALAKSSVEMADIANSSVADLAPEERATLDQWFFFFKSKYPIVGVLVAGQAAN